MFLTRVIHQLLPHSTRSRFFLAGKTMEESQKERDLIKKTLIRKVNTFTNTVQSPPVAARMRSIFLMTSPCIPFPVAAEFPADCGGAARAEDHPLQRLRRADGGRDLRPTRRQTLDATHSTRQGPTLSPHNCHVLH